MLYSKVDSKIISNNNETSESSSYLVNEETLELFINDKYYKTFTCIDTDIDLLVIGHLYTKHKLVTDLKFVDNKAYAKVKDTQIPKKNLDTKPNVFPLVECFMKNQKIHKFTSGTHSCIASTNGKITYIGEDIGRHNVMDKAIGHLVKTKADLSQSEIFTSARLSTSLVEKCINTGIKSLISKSVCTSQAKDLAKGKLNLVCKAWPDSYEVYV